MKILKLKKNIKKPWQWIHRENSHNRIVAVIIFTQTSKINFYPLADSIENNFKEGGAMYISSPNVDDGYTPNNNGTIYPWIDSEAQVKLKFLSSVSLNLFPK